MELVDRICPAPVASSEQVFTARIWSIRRDEVDLGRGGVVTRDLVDHPGAVSVLALADQGRVPLVFQYRHPVGMKMWELPAGLLDVADEPPHLAAARELAEEADLQAQTWHTLLDWQMTPGGSSEAMRCFLARDLSPVPVAG
jgi:8-oxo-dGDP phosphatase